MPKPRIIEADSIEEGVIVLTLETEVTCRSCRDDVPSVHEYDNYVSMTRWVSDWVSHRDPELEADNGT